MIKMRLRTKLLFSLLLVTVGLTSASLLVARRVMEKQVRQENQSIGALVKDLGLKPQ